MLGDKGVTKTYTQDCRVRPVFVSGECRCISLAFEQFWGFNRLIIYLGKETKYTHLNSNSNTDQTVIKAV